MKRTLSVILLCAIICVFALGTASCASKNDTVENLSAEYSKSLSGTTLKVYNWGEYISNGSDGTLNVNAAFEKLTGIKVEYSMYDDNETMYSDLAAGATYYDIIIPSDYMIQRLVSEGKLKELDYGKITNYGNVSDEYKNLYFDPDNKYSVPYNVGTVGLIYNKTMFDEAPTSWSALWDEKQSGQILMFNNPRDSFGIAQFILGQDVNTTNIADWDAAAELLKTQKPYVQNYVMDEVFNKMESGNAAIAPYYAGDYLSMAENNPDLGFVYPKEGTNIFCDSLCIPKRTQNYEAALMYINFMLEPEVALANAEYICYASPNKTVLDNEEYSLKDSDVLYPDKNSVGELQWFKNLDPEILSYYEGLWVDIKNS